MVAGVVEAQTPTPVPTPNATLCASQGGTLSFDLTAANADVSGGGEPWSSPQTGAAEGCGGSGPSVLLLDGEASQKLQVTAFQNGGVGFNPVIPDSAQVIGISIYVRRGTTNGVFDLGRGRDVNVSLLHPDLGEGGDNKAYPNDNWPFWAGVGGEYQYYGENWVAWSDTWGREWNGADIKSNAFGAQVSVKANGDISPDVAGVDCFGIYVCWIPECTTDADCKLDCCGDCTGNGVVTDDEATLCNDIYTSVENISACTACDCNGSGTISDVEMTEIIGNSVACCEQNGVCVANECVLPSPTPVPNTPTPAGGMDLFESTPLPTGTPTRTPTVTATPSRTHTPTNTIPPEELPVEAVLESIGSGDSFLRIEPMD